MLKKINLLKDVAAKLGRKNAKELFRIVENDAPFVIEVKIIKSGVKNNKEIIKLKEDQEVILEYVGI